jgi:hypothetical protein
MKLLHAALLLPLLATNLQAGGLVPAQIDAKARWIGHVDLQAFHDSQVWRAMLEADEKKEIEQGLSELFTTQGIDLFRDVRGATVYGAGIDDKDAVALIATTESAEPALARWREELKAKPIEIAGHACMQWHEGEEAAFSFLRSKPDSTDRLLVISHTRDGLSRALEVLEGQRASYATQPSAEISTTLAPGTFAFFAANGIFDQTTGMGSSEVKVRQGAGESKELHIGIGGDGPQSAIARLAQGVRVELGETGGRISLDVHVKTARDEDAVKLQKIVQGLMALASFAADEPDVGATLARWIEAVQVTRVDRTLGLSFAYDLKTLINEGRAIDAIEREKREEKGDKEPAKEPK